MVTFTSMATSTGVTTEEIMENAELIKKAKEALDIREPYWATVDEETGCVLFNLRSGNKTFCFPPQPEPCEVYKEPDFTTIPGVGKVTAQKLRDVGILTYEDLRKNFSVCFGLEIPIRTITSIEKYLQEETE